MRLFDSAAEQYDRARPAYPPALYDLVASECGALAGKRVADGGAGTGIVSRALLERGASVVAFDPGFGMLRRALARSPELPAMVAEAGVIPLRAGCLDLITFGQSWHWVQQEAGAREVARVLRRGGWWSAWWNQPWGDGEEWFDGYYSLLEARCVGMSRDQRETGWCAGAIADHGGFRPMVRHVVAWSRTVSVDVWLIDLSSHSYVIDLGESDRAQLLRDVEVFLRDAFADGTMVVPYETRLLMAQLTP